MSNPLSKNFEPTEIEAKWYRHWLDKRYFNSTPDDRTPFTIVMPPPNVTGVLHLGHTLNGTVQDVLIRKARMSGLNACWVPGSDHASIATESKVVELLEKQGIHKHELTREAFLAHAFEWKEKYGGIIYSQLKRIGCSVDWDRTTFTMDDHYYGSVIKVFVDLYKKGLIYRGARMINWDPAARTALSDEEVEHRDVEGRLYHVRYRIVGTEGDDPANFLVIATQRPETIMGDTGVCVNPNDERYQHLRGKKLIVPLVNRPVPVIFDEYVDPAFGTGALKVTPAHDINDYNLGLKHDLPVIETLNEDGTLSAAAEVFVGLDRFEARRQVVEQLRKEGLLVKEETYPTRLGFSQRTQAVIEPRISTQWFVKMKTFADKALEAVNTGEVKIHPEERFLGTYRHWLENVKDWCISRQLWWGQRIPAWYDGNGTVYVAETEAEARAAAGDRTLTQDEDVLDTWFSSWLWPMEVFNGISDPGNKEFEYYYPTSVLVTGQDIIFFWVARMIMAGMEYANEKPFDHVYFTGMVRDQQGRKMSKTLGNSPDLIELIDRFGADAVRFGVLISAPAGNDLLFDESSCEQGRNFNNKLWNALKLVQMWKDRQADSASAEGDAFAIQWFTSRLNEVRNDLEKMYAEFRLSEALKTVYSLIWDDFCSWYLEWVKPGFEQPVSAATYRATVSFFSDLMQLLHPFMPFITEEIYHLLDDRTDDLCIRQFDLNGSIDSEILQQGELLKTTISALRDARTKNNLKPRDPVQVHILATNPEGYSAIRNVLARQVNAESVHFTTEPIAGTINLVVGADKFFIETAQELDTAAQKEQLLKDLDYQQGFLLSVEKKLSNERFVQNAKPEVVDIERKKKADAEQKIKALQESLKGLS